MKKLPFLGKIFGLFNNKISSLLIVDLSSGLKLIEIGLKGEIKINAFKFVESLGEKKEEVIIKSLKDFIAQNNIQHKNAILVPSLSQIFTKRIKLPAVPLEEVAEAAKWVIKDELPFDLAKAAFDYRIVDKTIGPDGSKVLDLICIAAEDEEIRKQVLLLKQVGLNCISVTFAAFGYAKLLERYFGAEKGKNFGILHISQKNSYLAVCSEGAVVFFRSLPMAIDRLRESLASELLTEKGKVKLTPLEINDILFKYGIPSEGSALYQDKMAANQILALLRPSLEMLVQEIKRSCSYYLSQFKGEVSKVFICQEGAMVPSLDKFLSKELAMDISDLLLPQEIQSSASVNAFEASQSSAAIGLALGYPDIINLLPIEFRTEKIEKFQKVSLRWVSFVAFVLLIMFYLLARAGVGAYQKRLDNALFQLNVLSEIKQIKNKIDAFDGFFSEIKNSEFQLARMLEVMSSIAKRDLFLNSFIVSNDTKIGSMAGFVRSKNNNPEAILTKFVGDLESSEYFKEVNIAKIADTNIQGVEAATFEINFKLQ